jgi:hypothetical protein
MSTTSQKHQDFVSEPMGDKIVSFIAGIGPTLGNRLSEKGFDKAYKLLGQFLMLDKDEDLFRRWLKETCGCNSHQSLTCYNCLNDWCLLYI